MPIQVQMTKAEAVKVAAALRDKPWAAAICAVIEQQLAAEPPWRKVVKSNTTHSSGYGALNNRYETLECGHKWESGNVRWPNNPPDPADRRRCKQCVPEHLREDA